jgi:transglutaminase-like putative cysteine protease
MNRRFFLKSSACAATASMLPWRAAQATAPGWRGFEIVTRVEPEVLGPRAPSRAWVPLPLIEDNAWQKPLNNAWSGNALRAQIKTDGKYGVSMLYAEWSPSELNPRIEVASRFMTRDRAVDLSRPMKDIDLPAADRAFYTAPTELIATDGIVRKTALEITRGAQGEVEKARAIYEWIVDNTFRDPKVRGCGLGDIKGMLETGNLGGKCADLNALFTGLARSVGVPARDVYGVRIASSEYGYKSLGIGSPNATRAQHCRAEFFARGFGWVPVDPADVRKVALEEPPGKLPLDSRKVAAARKRLFGSWEMNWVAYNRGADVKLPHSNAPKLAYLMYVNAETGGEMLDQLDPDRLRYSIIAREVRA